MNSKLSPYPDLAFVDIETTGSHFDRDRITEIGIKTLTGNDLQVWERLIDPQTYIPLNIQRLTGISPAMVNGQPSFSEFAEDLKKELEGKKTPKNAKAGRKMRAIAQEPRQICWGR